MHGDKAPGSDGFNPAFFSQILVVSWERDFYVFNPVASSRRLPRWVERCERGADPQMRNSSLHDKFAPISLCNMIYKILSKVLCNRLKYVIPGLVDKAQSTFISGHNIQDNILLAFETIHTMKTKRVGRRGDVALKIDISKAYDIVDWNYLENILVKLGFSSMWVNWMMLCIKTVKYSFLVNGESVGPIAPGCGLR